MVCSQGKRAIAGQDGREAQIEDRAAKVVPRKTRVADPSEEFR